MVLLELGLHFRMDKTRRIKYLCHLFKWNEARKAVVLVLLWLGRWWRPCSDTEGGIIVIVCGK